jgi:nicotinamidase/pyrazinamidase
MVVDVQNGFTKFGNLASPRCAEALPRIREIVELEANRGAGLIFTADTHAPDDAEFKMFPPHCIDGTSEQEIVAELAPFVEKATVVRKRRYSAFHDTDLEQILAKMAPAEVGVVGVCTDICVLHTVADLRNRDYPVQVYRDGVETFDASDHPAAEINRWSLAHMRTILGAEVV